MSAGRERSTQGVRRCASRGELIVCAVRAQMLEDVLRLHVRALRDLPLPKVLHLSGGNTAWAAQRLASACDRALGTRQRHYDIARR